MSNEWVGLDDEADVSQGSNGNVQYVGVIDTPDAATPEVRMPRRPVQRVTPSAKPVQSNGAVTRSGFVGGSKGREPMVYFPTESGAQVALNREAAANMSQSKLHNIDGKPALRVQPGTYVMVVPNRFPDDTPRRARPRRRGEDEMDLSGMGTVDAAQIMSSIGRILDPLATLGVGVGTLVTGEREAQRQAALEQQRITAQNDAAAAARQAAAAEQTRQHAENMARLRQQAAELAALGPTGGAAPGGVVASTGTSPIVWVVLGVVAIGGIGGLVWFLSSRKKSE